MASTNKFIYWKRTFLIYFILFAYVTKGMCHLPDKHESDFLPEYKYQLAICAVFQNEAPYLKEWIEYHKLIGVEHFYLFNNFSRDDFLSVLRPYIASGEVELYEWPLKTVSWDNWRDIQQKVYEYALKKAFGRVKWLAMIDIDEFILPMHVDNLCEFLEDYEEFGGITINWQLFGTSHVPKIPQDKLLIESLIYKCPEDFIENSYVKSIVRPEAVATVIDAHIVSLKPGYLLVNPNKEICDSAFSPTIEVDKIRINHYWSRDEHYFFHTKLARRNSWNPECNHEYFGTVFLNQILDTTILRFAPRLRQAMNLD